MAFAPIALTIPQYEDFPNQFLKFYEPGTTTPKLMATDIGGLTTLAKAQLNNSGFPTTDGSTLFIPFVNANYDLFLFPTATEADNNDTSNALRFANNIDNSSTAGTNAYDNSTSGLEATTVQGAIDEVVEVRKERYVTYGDFGADPTGVLDSASAIQAAIDFCADNQVQLRGEKGTFKVLSRLLVPKRNGFKWIMERGCVLDSSSAPTAFFTIDLYSDRAVGVSTDFTEGFSLDGGMVIPSDVIGSYGIALFFVLNTSSIRNIEIRGGDGGLLITKSFYGFYENIKIKDQADIGFSLLTGGTGDTGVNANYYKGLFITGCKHNMVFEDLPGSSANVAIFDSCTFENSKETSVKILSVRPVKFSGCYFEGNFSDGAGAGDVVEIDALDATIILEGGFMNTNLTHDPDAFSVSGDNTVRITDFDVFKKKGTITNFYNPAIFRVDYLNDSPNSDFSNSGSGYATKKDSNAATKRMVPHIDGSTAGKTIAPISGTNNNASSEAVTDLVEIDITTGQLRSGWSFVFQAISYESNSINLTRRGLSVIIHISAFKDGTEFNINTTVVSSQLRLSSASGVYTVTSDGTSKITVAWDGQSAGDPHTQDIQWQIRDFVCRTNGDIVGVNLL